MNANSQNVFMNGVTKDGEGFLLFITDYGIGIGEVQGVGSGEGGLDLKQVLMINVDRMFNETTWRFLKLKLLHYKNIVIIALMNIVSYVPL